MDNWTKEQWIDSWIALAMNGGTFVRFAAGKLLALIYLKHGLDWEVCLEMLVSAACRKDKLAMKQYLADWST